MATEEHFYEQLTGAFPNPYQLRVRYPVLIVNDQVKKQIAVDAFRRSTRGPVYAEVPKVWTYGDHKVIFSMDVYKCDKTDKWTWIENRDVEREYYEERRRILQALQKTGA